MLRSLLPGGEADDDDDDAAAADGRQDLFERVPPSAEMQTCVLAVVQAEPNDSLDGIRDASVVGFVYVAEVDEKKRKVRVLAPMAGRVPRKAMVWGLWPEGVGELVG